VTTSIDDLAAEISGSVLFQRILVLCDAAGLPITALQELEAPRVMLATFSDWGASIYNTIIRRAIQAQYGDLVVDAGRTWATFWGLSRYGVAPDDATFAEGPCLLTNTKGGAWSFAPGTFQVKNSTTSKVFRNTETVTLAAWPGSGPYPTQTVNFRALEAGTASTSSAGTIDALVTTANGVTVSNPGILAGQDEEPLVDFVIRARGTPALLSPNGPKAAFETVLRRTLRSDGSRIPINRVRFRTPTGNGVVRAIVAGPSGAVSVADVARLLLNVQTLAEPWGMTAQVASATSVLVNYNITAYARQSPTLTTTAIVNNGNAALVSLIGSAPIGGWNSLGGDSGFVYSSELAAAVSEAQADVFKADNATADTVIGAEDVSVLGTGTITPVIV